MIILMHENNGSFYLEFEGIFVSNSTSVTFIAGFWCSEGMYMEDEE